MEWLSENWATVTALGAVAADIVAGWLPDKYVNYPGIILSIANKMYQNGKTPDKPKKRKRKRSPKAGSAA